MNIFPPVESTYNFNINPFVTVSYLSFYEARWPHCWLLELNIKTGKSVVQSGGGEKDTVAHKDGVMGLKVKYIV